VFEHLSACDPRGRSVVVVLLLGPGPFKRSGSVSLGGGETVSWPAYDEIDQPGPFTAELHMVGEEPASSVVVEDLWATARDDLSRRYDRLLAEVTPGAEDDSDRVRRALAVDRATAARIVAAFSSPQELLGWWSLPASIHVIRAEVPESVQWCGLLVRDHRELVLADELIRLPDQWDDGPIFVVRRVP
jgi:hypothetical protein